MTKRLDLRVFPDATWEDWRAKVEADLSSRTLDGLRIQPLYGPAPAGPARFPGQPPFDRGAQAKSQWGMVQEYANPNRDATLRELKEDLRRDADGVWFRFDDRLRDGCAASTSFGSGLNVRSIEDMGTLLAALDLRRHKVFLDAGAGSRAVVAAFLEAAASQGIAPRDLRGCLGVNPLSDAVRGASLPKADPFRNLVELASWCQAEAPGLRAALVSTANHHDAGASPVQELAFAMASGAEILRRLTTAGLSVDDAFRQILFAFSVTGDLFGEIAKLRAARLLWWRVAKACGASEEAAAMVLHCRTSHRTSTIGDRGVNALRGTVETVAAALGGADTVTTAPFDEALLVAGGAFGRKVAANTQLILREESFLGRVTDPAGGSWYVEALTEQLAAAAWELFQALEGEGGFAAATRQGTVRSRVLEMGERRHHLLATRQIPMTGVSEYPNLNEAPYEPASGAAVNASPPLQNEPRDPAAQPRGSLQRRAGESGLERDRRLLRSGLSLSEVAEGAGEGAGEGEGDGDQEVWPKAVLTERRDAADFEALCQRSRKHLEKTGSRPQVFLANLGPLRAHRIRSGFVRNLLAAAGIESLSNAGFTDAGACADAFASSGSKAAVLCSSDAAYSEMAVPVAEKLREQGASRILLAGQPGERAEDYRQAGIHGFLHQGCDVIVAAGDLLDALGVDP